MAHKQLTEEECLHINKNLHNRGVVEFKPILKIVTIEYAVKFRDWCKERYTNINGDNVSYIADYHKREYCDNTSYISFMVSETPPKEKCRDYYKEFGDKGFNPRTHNVHLSVFEVLYNVSTELGIVKDFEYSNEFIERVISL